MNDFYQSVCLSVRSCLFGCVSVRACSRLCMFWIEGITVSLCILNSCMHVYVLVCMGVFLCVTLVAEVRFFCASHTFAITFSHDVTLQPCSEICYRALLSKRRHRNPHQSC